MTNKYPERNLVWWAKCIFHNCIVHPMLPFADYIDSKRKNMISDFIYHIHDTSYPKGGG
jgi:hypothetical protein